MSFGPGTPIIYDAHDFYSDVIPTWLGKRLEAWCIRKAAAVVTVSKGVKKLIQREFGSKALVVRNCHDARLEKTPSKNLREALNLPSDAFLLVTVGQAKPGLAAAEAMEALATLPEKVHLALIGKNTSTYQEIVQRYELRSRVHLVPPVKQDEVVQFIQSADVALILYYPFSSNYINCLPNGFFQSFSAGLPLLYPELPEIKKLAEQHSLGLPIDPRSPESIRMAVMSMLNDDRSLAKHKANSLAARLALSWEQEEVNLYDLVRGVIEKGQVVAS
jgi:glycosyltransferase involved in cell wall biosynthesis